MLKKNLAKILPVILFLIVSFSLVSFDIASAQSGGQGTQSGTGGVGVQQQSINQACQGSQCTLSNPFTFSTVAGLVDKILDILIKVGWILAFFFLIYAGFLFVTAGGSEDQINSAKKTFMWTLIGSAIVLGAKALAVLIEATIVSIVGR